MAETKLEKEHQVFIVQSLASFERLVDVQDALKQFFEIEISLPAIIHYDIRNPKFPAKWKSLFLRCRNKFLKDAAKIPISNKAFRLSKLQNMFDQEEKSKIQNKVAMRAILEQAAKESGDVFSNKQKLEHTGKDGAPIETKQSVDLSKLTTEELMQWKKLVEKTNG